MSRVLRSLVVVALVGTLLPTVLSTGAGATHDNPPGCAKERITGYIPVAQDDPLEATTLHYQVFLPKDEIGGPGPYPAVMDYSGYQPGMHIWDGLHRHWTCQGYAVVGLNLRGTGCSGGDFDYFEPRQAEDGREAIEFLTDQWWSNGRLAMVGKSYPGITQLFVAGQPLEPGGSVETPEGLVAIVPGHVFGDLYRDVPYPGGIMNVTFAAGWSAGRIYEPFQAPIEDELNKQGLIPDEPDPEHLDEYEYSPSPDPARFDQQCMANMAQHAANPPQNPFVKAAYNQHDGGLFKERSPWYWAHNIEVPTFLVEAWQDEQVGSRATELIERFDPDLTWRALFTNGDHGEYYGPDVLPYLDEFLSFYLEGEVPAGYQGGTVTETDYKNPVRDKGKSTTTTRPETFEEALARYEASDPVRINWETGAPGGREASWSETYDGWLASETVPWRLNFHSDGKLAQAPDADGGSVTYDYVPGYGTQARGGFTLSEEPEPIARWSETPPDGTYAMFTTNALDQDRLFAGPASVDLTLASTAPDTDLQVTLTEVRPDGQEVFVQQGWLRASHRAEDPTQSTELRPYQTHLLADSQPLVPMEPTPMRVEIFPFAHAFRAGSKIRLYIEAPHVKPDLWGFALLPLPAQNTIDVAGSSVALPLLEGATAPNRDLSCSLRSQFCRDAVPEPSS